nr:hypothetical protein [Tanacetum cinerariifolium]
EEVIHEMSFKTYSNPLFDLDEEIISNKFNLIHNEDLDSTPKNDRFDTKSYLLESEEFSDKLAHTDLIPPRINEANCDPEEDINLVERLLDPFMEEIDFFLASDVSIPPGIDSDYSDFEGDNIFLERLLHDDPIPLLDILDFSNEDTFSKNKNDDAYEHVKRVLDIVSLFNIPGVSHDAVMLYCPTSKTAKQLEEIRNFKQEGDKPLYQAWERGNIESSSSSEGIAAIVNKLENLGRDMKKLKVNVHAIQVGCQIYEGAHIDKDFPFYEGIKSMEEVKYRVFGRPFPLNNRNNRRFNKGGYDHPSSGERRPNLTKIINKYIEEASKRHTEQDEWLKKFYQSTEANREAHDKIIQGLETKVKTLANEVEGRSNNEKFKECKAIYFVILDMVKDIRIPIILRRPLLAMAHTKITRERFRDEEDDLEENLEDLEECKEDKENTLLGVIHDKLNNDWFNNTSEDEDDLEGILDYLKPRSYDGSIDLDHEAYNKIRNGIRGLLDSCSCGRKILYRRHHKGDRIPKKDKIGSKPDKNEKRNVEDKILVPKPPKNCARCTRCGYLVDGSNCQGCALLRQELEENLVTHSPDFQNSFEPSNASINVVNAPREPYDAHIGYNCPSKVPVSSNQEPCNNQTIDEFPQTLPV